MRGNFFVWGGGKQKKSPLKSLLQVKKKITDTNRNKKDKITSEKSEKVRGAGWGGGNPHPCKSQKRIKKTDNKKIKPPPKPPHTKPKKQPAPTPPKTAGMGQKKGVENFFGWQGQEGKKWRIKTKKS